MFLVIIIISFVTHQVATAPTSCGPSSVWHTDNRRTQDSLCCIPVTCNPGYGPNLCNSSGAEAFCTPCDIGWYNSKTLSSAPPSGSMELCQRFTYCKEGIHKEKSAGNATQDRVCECKDGGHMGTFGECYPLCLPGKYWQKGEDSCWDCTNGKTFTNTSGREECSNCTLCGTTKTACNTTHDAECLLAANPVDDVTQGSPVTENNDGLGPGIIALIVIVIVLVVVGAVVLAGLCICKNKQWLCWRKESSYSTDTQRHSEGVPMLSNGNADVSDHRIDIEILPAEHGTTPTRPAINSTEPVANTTQPLAINSTEPVANTTQPLAINSTEPVANTIQPLAINSTEPVANTNQPGIYSTEPFANTAQPASNSTKPVANTTQPASNSTKPVANATQPASNSTKPVANTTQPAINSTKPVANTTQPASNSTKPLANTTQPAINSTKPVANTTRPASNSTKPLANTTQPAEPVANADQPADIRVEPDGVLRQSVDNPAELHVNVGQRACGATLPYSTLCQDLDQSLFDRNGLLASGKTPINTNSGQDRGDAGQTGAFDTFDMPAGPAQNSLQPASLALEEDPEDPNLNLQNGQLAARHSDPFSPQEGQRDPNLDLRRNDPPAARHSDPFSPQEGQRDPNLDLRRNDPPAVQNKKVERYNNAIQGRYNDVQKTLMLDNFFLGALLSSNVITDLEHAQLRLLKKQYDGNADALPILRGALRRSGDKACDPFLRALIDPGSRQDNIALLIDPEEAEKLIWERDNRANVAAPDRIGRSKSVEDPGKESLTSIRDSVDHSNGTKILSEETQVKRVDGSGDDACSKETQLKEFDGSGDDPGSKETQLKEFDGSGDDPGSKETQLKEFDGSGDDPGSDATQVKEVDSSGSYPGSGVPWVDPPAGADKC